MLRLRTELTQLNGEGPLGLYSLKPNKETDILLKIIYFYFFYFKLNIIKLKT